MRRLAAALMLLVASAAGARSAWACAGCRNPNLPVTRLGAVTLAPKEVRLTVAATATAVHVVHEDGCPDLTSCAETPVQPLYLHDQMLYPTELRVMAEVGLTAALGLELHLPLRAVRTSINFTTPEGAPYQPLDPDVHHRDETVTGLADAWLLGRAATSLSGWFVAARVGSTLPIGHTEEDPFALGDQGLRHQHIQLGNGTFDPLLALDAARSFGRLSVSGYVMAQVSLYKNSHGFRAGNRVMGGVAGGGVLGQQVSTLLGLDLMNEQPERWSGVIRQDGNLGRTELLAGLTLMRPFGDTTVSASVRVPLYRRIISGTEAPGRFSSPVILTVTVGRVFGGG